MIDPAIRIWAYVHNEMDPKEKEQFRRMLRRNTELRQVVEQCRLTHNHLKEGLPLLLTKEETFDLALEKRLLAEWEAQHAEPPQTAHGPHRRILFFAAPLAAAAALIIFFSLPLQNGSIRWQSTVYGTAPQLRGQTGLSAHYTQSDLKDADQTLRKAIETACREAHIPSGSWTLQISLQELAEGNLDIEVSGVSRAIPAVSREWRKIISSFNELQSEGPAFGNQIAKDIAGSDQ